MKFLTEATRGDNEFSMSEETHYESDPFILLAFPEDPERRYRPR